MVASLSRDITMAYGRDGFVFPVRVMDGADALTFRTRLEQLEAAYAASANGETRRSLNTYFRQNVHYVSTLANELCRLPAILDAVESVLGPDLLVWSVEFIIKEPRTSRVISWHQDLTYWGLGETDHEVTAWLALSPATRASGCMQFVAGSHKNAIVAHNDTYDDDNLLSRGQEIAVDVSEDEAVDVALQPGEMSLHHGRMFHASGPNTSDDRRIGVAIRYITPDVRQEVAETDYAMLVRGIDAARNFAMISPPIEDFSRDALAMYERIFAEQAKALGAGATDSLSY